MNDFKEIDLNEAFLKALHLAEETDRNLFITGRAGTGKSTFLNYFRANTKKEVAVLAPTGVAAVNVKGQTVHSFFGFKPDVTMHKIREIRPKNPHLYKKLDCIVIDEISMVRADILDCIDCFLRIHGKIKKKPFGGIQMIFIGDLYQLPPVVTSRERWIFKDFYKTPYFFDASVFKECEFEFVELEKVYRQSEIEFLEILNSIRNNTITDEIIEKLNTRVKPDFNLDEDAFYIYLTPTNKTAEEINSDKISKIKNKEVKYYGYIDGEFTESDLPTSQELILKVDAQVMLLNNDSKGRWINGDIGKIVDIQTRKTESDIIVVELTNGEVVEVTPFTWEMYEFYYDRAKKKILTDVVGQFTQYPLKLAWAITIHKSQGLTFDKMILDIGKGTFSHGQLYVALSRCRSIDGLILKKPVSKKHILLDRRIVRFLTQFQYKYAEKTLPLEEKISIIENAINEGKEIEILYLKSTDIKSKRVLKPSYIGYMEYGDKKFLGLKAFCMLRKQERHFNVEKILDVKVVN
ncbi:MAG TPA: AAA family ATPase [Thermodesulfovibrio thiophilus]|uniref:AAA family ATPase n=1 Tax=Thermodesulfovibrio thiophilus TaxID=340095 RepID=UPI0017CEBD0E|nr:AAA family ATPase [Thermodesulfovibrio thiophilus]HHW19616.1 AAA family ATPase [Thermodesulfovibrio thiophilus]HOA82418.1 AAA family ATPase [Thermodesulfovibrio thiophilus]HQA04032.1 AAA family ATPase [Thermodesulfovibrio thiophilus]